MSNTDGTPKPIVELKPGENEPPAMSSALRRRIRQQEILAELGVTALQGASFNQLMNDTARLTAEGMQAEFCKVLEYSSAEKLFSGPCWGWMGAWHRWHCQNWCRSRFACGLCVANRKARHLQSP